MDESRRARGKTIPMEWDVGCAMEVDRINAGIDVALADAP